MAAGGVAAPAGQLHELQPSAEHGERRRVEPEHHQRGAEGPPEELRLAKNGGGGEAGGAGELAEGVGGGAVGGGDGGAIRVEIRPVQAAGGVPCDGVLPHDGEGGRGDA